MADNSTPTLREALAEVLASSCGSTLAGRPCRIRAAHLEDAAVVLASLVEHRDDVLDALGMEQVGWHSERYGLYGRHADPAVLRRVSAVRPAYAFRPKEQPATHLPRGHSGREHVTQTGHDLALSTFTASNCAECDWSSEAALSAAPISDEGEK